MELLYAFLSFRCTYLQSDDKNTLVHWLKVKDSYQWTGTVVQLAELVYALDKVKCVDSKECTHSMRLEYNHYHFNIFISIQM